MKLRGRQEGVADAEAEGEQRREEEVTALRRRGQQLEAELQVNEHVQCSSQRQLQRAVLSQRSKHSCGLITSFQPHQKKMVYLRAVEHCSSAL